MAARNIIPARGLVARRPSEASRREIVISFASVLVLSALIYLLGLSVMRVVA